MGMQFDDRLATVLRMRADSAAVRRIQLRQLVDLLGTCPSTAYGPAIDAAYARLGELQRDLSPEQCVELLRDPALRLRSPRLVAALANGDPRLAAAALQRADLGEEQWFDLIPALPPEARHALHQREDLAPALRGLLARLGVRGRGLPPSAAAAAAQAPPAPIAAAPPVIEMDTAEADTPQPAASAPDAAGSPLTEAGETVAVLADGNARGERIGAIVKRIEAYRKAKQIVDHAPGDAPRLPLGEDHVLSVSGPVRACDFATDSQGRIVWSDAGAAPMLVGQRIGEDTAIARLIRRQQPLAGQMIALAGAEAIAGRWQIDATPWFDPLGGRFMGYRGRLRRPALPHVEASPAVLPDSEADRVRQMLHELRTPVNAIQVGAEIIQQQLYGPSPHEYRALAATIAGDAAKILAAFEELERLAKLDSGAIELERGETDLAAVLAATAGQLDAHTKTRGSGFDIRLETAATRVPLAQIELERMIWRLLATLAGTSTPGERLKLRLRDKGGAVRLDVTLPASLAKLDDKALFGAGPGAVPQVIAAGMFGAGFALRLARAEAQAGGGELKRKGDRLRLTLPGLTKAGPGHTDGNQGSDQNAA